MSDLMKKEAEDLLDVIHSWENGTSAPVPFDRDIFLFDTYVAGTTHVDGIEELEPFLKPGDRLDFYREPQNPYDNNAIKITTVEGIKIGYVPKRDNLIFSRLMDAGKLIFGRIYTKEQYNSWIKIYIKVFLHDGL